MITEGYILLYRLNESRDRDHVVHLCSPPPIYNCGCVVDGGNAMAAI